jgi:Concanavalin A-like lectin/glucanases superfamily
MGRFILVAGLASVTACSVLVDTNGLTGGSAGDASTEDTGAAEASAGDEGGARDTGAPPGDSSSDADAGLLPCNSGGDPDLVGYYPLDETTGTVVSDCSGLGHNGTVISEPAGGPWVGGKHGGGFRGDGTAGCIDLGTPQDLLVESASFTVALWVSVHTYPSGVSARYMFGRTMDSASSGYRLATYVSNAFLWSTHSTTARVDTNGSTGEPTDTWLHVAVTFVPGASSVLFVNGLQQGTAAATAMAPDPGATVRIGCRGDGTLVIDGIVDEVRVYKRALTAAEVLSLSQK